MANRTRKLLSEMQGRLDIAIRRDAIGMLRRPESTHMVVALLVLANKAKRDAAKAVEHAEKEAL
jgi:hypothetical protein